VRLIGCSSCDCLKKIRPKTARLKIPQQLSTVLVRAGCHPVEACTIGPQPTQRIYAKEGEKPGYHGTGDKTRAPSLASTKPDQQIFGPHLRWFLAIQVLRPRMVKLFRRRVDKT
jgi:hypothetical protein